MWYCTFFSVSNWDVSFVSVALMDILMMFFSLTCLLCIAYHIYFGINHVDHCLSFLALCLQLKVVLNVIPVLTLMLWCSWTRLPCEQCFPCTYTCMHAHPELSASPGAHHTTPGLIAWDWSHLCGCPRGRRFLLPFPRLGPWCVQLEISV